MLRRRIVLAACALVAGWGGPSAAQQERAGERRVRVAAAKFAFSVAEIRAKKGETLIIALTASDFVHGFSIPELNARIDIPPGKPVELTLRSLPAGQFVYLCDNFCGEDHERMTGRLMVL